MAAGARGSGGQAHLRTLLLQPGDVLRIRKTELRNRLGRGRGWRRVDFDG